MRTGKALSTSLLAAMALCTCCCGGSEPGIALELTLLRKSLHETRGGSTSPPGTPPGGIDAFRLCAATAHGEKKVCEDFTDLTAPSFVLGGVPAGKDLVVTFRGYSYPTENEPVRVPWCGRTAGVEVKKNETTQVRMLISPCRDFALLEQSMSTPRAFASANALSGSNAVLLAGGFDNMAGSDPRCGVPCAVLRATDAIEMLDAGDGSFRPVGQLNRARGLHASMELSDGRILLAGGCEAASLQAEFIDPDRPGPPLACLEPGDAATTAEIVDPRTGTIQGPFEIPPAIFSAPAFGGPDRLLLVGGLGPDGKPLNRVVAIDVVGASVETTVFEGALEVERAGAVAVPITNREATVQQILVFGGIEAAGLENPGIFAEWLVAGRDSLGGSVPRFVEQSAGLGLPVLFPLAARVAAGNVVVAGGVYSARYRSLDTPFLPRPLREAALIDSAQDRLEMLDQSRRLKTARLFAATPRPELAGQPIVAGGFDRLDGQLPAKLAPTDSVESWDDTARQFVPLWKEGRMLTLNVARAASAFAELENGMAIVCGGIGTDGILSSCELYNPMKDDLGD